MTEERIPNPNSMTLWFPAVEALALPHPKTIMVPVSEAMWGRALDGKPPIIEDAAAVDDAATEIGYPLFLRNDLTSGKHSWRETCYVPDRASLWRHVYAVIEDAELHWVWPVMALALREFVPLQSTFTAFDGMPVSCERRYFAKDGVIQCWHPYWPEAAIKAWGHDRLPKDWRDRLSDLNRKQADEIVLPPMACAITAKLGGAWSVDFAKTKAGEWLLIDMALASSSHHEPHEEGL